MVGKTIRMERIFDRNSGRTVIVPLDHGVTAGPMEGLISMKDTVSKVAQGGANAVLMHKGMVRAGHRGHGKDLGLIIHLSASTNLSENSNSKALVGNVEEAIKLGADAVSVHVNLGDRKEEKMLGALGNVASSAQEWGVPVLAMVYGRGPKIKDQYNGEVVAHCARVAEELGADVAKVNYTGSVENFRKVVRSCNIPVVIAGGAKMNNEHDVLDMTEKVIQAGGAGLSIGRNIFQAKDPKRLVAMLSSIVHSGCSYRDLLLKEKPKVSSKQRAMVPEAGCSF